MHQRRNFPLRKDWSRSSELHRKPSLVEPNLPLRAVFVIAVLCLAASFCVSLNDYQAKTALNETVLTIFKLACGALIALLSQGRKH